MIGGDGSKVALAFVAAGEGNPGLLTMGTIVVLSLSALLAEIVLRVGSRRSQVAAVAPELALR